jgi:hypothetical protein
MEEPTIQFHSSRVVSAFIVHLISSIHFVYDENQNQMLWKREQKRNKAKEEIYDDLLTRFLLIRDSTFYVSLRE